MKTAWSLYLNREISAREALRAQVSTRPACPRCRELVHLVRRAGAAHFSHWPQNDDSPACPLRTEGGHTTGPTTHSGPPRDDWLRESLAFRQALLDTHRLTAPAAPDATLDAFLRQIARMLQGTRRELAGPPQRVGTVAGEHRDVFPLGAEAIVREALRAPDPEHASLSSEDHLQLVLRLWDHLRQPQVEDDLMFLLLLARAQAAIGDDEIARARGNLAVYVPLVDRLLAAALRLLARVPWMELQSDAPEPGPSTLTPARPARIEQCDDCGDEVENARRCPRCRVPLCEEHAEQHERWTCPDCGQRPCDTRATGLFSQCWVCEEWICSECYKPCENCGEDICDDCYHGRWSCEGCGGEFCENAVEEEEKSECPSCDNPYCETCAGDSLVSCAGCGKDICNQCGEECEECGEMLCGDCVDEHAASHAEEDEE